MTRKHALLLIICVLLLLSFLHSPQLSMICAGIGVFLLGMAYLEQGFKVFTGGLLEDFLQKATSKLWKSLSFGIVTTGLLQSSSLVSLIVISFLSAGLITLTAGIGIIYGANVGSTLGAWLVALYGLKLQLLNYAMPLLVFGLLLRMQEENGFKGTGYVLLGVGFLLLGIHYIKIGFDEFGALVDFSRFAMEGVQGILVYTLFGVIITILMQSTNATMVVAFSAVAVGQLTYENALALAIGSNMGTTFTAVLGAISANGAGKRLAVAHIGFNTITSLFAIGFFYPLQNVVDVVSGWFGIAANNYLLKIAVFNSLFNMMGILIQLPFMSWQVNKLEQLFVASDSDDAFDGSDMIKMQRARYLTPAVLNYPDAALRALTRECEHLYRNTLEIICYSMLLSGEKLREADHLPTLVKEYVREEQPWTIKQLYQKHIAGVYADIIHYAGAMAPVLPHSQMQELFALKIACRDFAQAVKHVKHIYQNMSLYLNSDNEPMREQYNQLRLSLASVLKLIDVLGVRRNYFHIHHHAEQLKKELAEQDEQIQSTLNELIRSEKIDSFMASALLNDSAHIHDACTNLIDGAVIMLTRDREEYQDMALMQDE